MRNYLHIKLDDQTVEKEERSGEDLVKIGRYMIAKTLLEEGVATVDPLSPDNPLIFSAGPLAGTTFSNANRISVGCKSPLTGGIKEANGGGTFAYALGQLNLCGLTLYGASDEWVVIHIRKDGTISFDSAEAYMGKGNFEAAALLHEKYGKKVSLGLCGPVGEYEGLLAGISFSDVQRRPARLAARGGVGAVMGNKKVKAIVVDLNKTPALYDSKEVKNNIRAYSKMLRESPPVMNVYNKIGTMAMADYQNYIGGLPVRNFSAGQLVNPDEGIFKMGGDFIRAQNVERGGKHTHACMPGCVIQCSNVYADADGKEVVSPVEYETLGLLGTNCGISEPDELAMLNHIANDLGVDTIETGAMLAVLMEAELAEFGDVDFMVDALKEIKEGSQKGQLWAQGTARVGEHYGLERVPTVKKQAISAYDPRVVEVTGISMMVSAQGADHTAGNVPRVKSSDKELNELMDLSLDAQIVAAATDSIGLCIFGRSVTNSNTDFLANAVNKAVGSHVEQSFFLELGRETLKYEAAFNKAAGFTVADDNLPAFFYNEPLAPTNNVARFHADQVQDIYDRLP
ncbi:MAG: aldehyde ferredoxin oxidoreductase C-terminal domain-containing protein [Ardenticatenaceae bacterium]